MKKNITQFWILLILLVGYGTISNAQIATQPSGSVTSASSYQTANIDASETSTRTNPKWIPIGNDTNNSGNPYLVLQNLANKTPDQSYETTVGTYLEMDVNDLTGISHLTSYYYARCVPYEPSDGTHTATLYHNNNGEWSVMNAQYSYTSDDTAERFKADYAGVYTFTVEITDDDHYPTITSTRTIQVTVTGNITVPTVTTQAVSVIGSTSATGNGNISNTGGVNVTERGIYYSTTDGFADGTGTKVSATGDWSSTGDFTQLITGLTPNITYYVKAFATNSAGTGYGSQVSFTTLDGTVFDFESSVTGIGTKTVQQTKSGETLIINATDYNLVDAVSYTSGVALSGSTSVSTDFNDTGGLETNLSFSVSGKAFDVVSLILANYDGDTETIVLTSSKGTATFTVGGDATTLNVAAHANASYFEQITSFTITEQTPSETTDGYALVFDDITLNNFATAPTVTTQTVSNISKTSATGNGTITATGGANITERGFYWSTNNGFADGTGTKVSTTGNWSTTGAFTQEITGLSPGTTYYVKAFATSSAGTGYGSQVSFTTKATPVITWSNPVDITYGTLLSATQLNATANTAGTFTYTPALGTSLNAGNGQTLKADFTPTDLINYEATSKTVTINVAKGTPVITWSNPADIIYGTLLSETQLNATANVAGSFVYTPSFGTILSSGDAQALKANFEPTDIANYESVSKTVYINVSFTTGISEVGTNKFQVFPNPVIDFFSVSGIEGRAKITLSDLNGRVILTKEISNNEMISLDNFSRGIYIILLEDINGFTSMKIVKK